MNKIMTAVLTGEVPFCCIQKQDSDEILILQGVAARYGYLKDIPRRYGPPGDSRRYDTISVVPFCQIKERGFSVHDGGEQIRSIDITTQCSMHTTELMRILSDHRLTLDGPIRYDSSESEYGEIISSVINKEIGEGEGANFVIPRNGQGTITDFSIHSAFSIFRTMVSEDYGTYWKFLFYDTSRYFIGSTPERHLEVERGRVRMNPISGTFRKGIRYECRNHLKSELVKFLNDPKEINELFMVVDEELKMMAQMCSDGGAVIGPLLKEMSQLIHTEYLLSGASSKDIIELFRDSMFAATVVGSPVENACRIIRKYSKESRHYYGSALMLIGRDPDGEDYLDAPITIRTLEIDIAGDFRFSTGATLVKDSLPKEEVAETLAKSSAILRPFRSNQEAEGGAQLLPGLANDDDIVEALSHRNQSLSTFWFFQQDQRSRGMGRFAGLTITLIDNGDDFIYMLRHLFSHLGFTSSVIRYADYRADADRADITLVGPGPGNPTNDTDEKIAKNKSCIDELMRLQRKTICICLGHQLLCRHLGFALKKKRRPLQGTQMVVDLFGEQETVGFYNTFAAISDVQRQKAYDLARLPATDEIAAIRGHHFVGYQFHPESILTRNGVSILCQTVDHLLR